MNNRYFLRHLVMVLLLAVFMAGCAGTRTSESTGEYMDNSVITAKVKAAILEDPMLKVFQINVESFKGEVQLSGFVDSAQAAARAVQITRRVEGVTSVKNSLVIK